VKRQDVKYDSDKLQADAQCFIDSFKVKMRSIADEAMGELYSKVMPYIETDAWTNYREALRIELEHEYMYSNFRDDWASNFRRAVFVENRDEISDLISKDILKRIKHMEDCKQEFEMFRYSPKGDSYQDILKERDEYRVALESIETGKGRSGLSNHEAIIARDVLAKYPKE
jgi:hypothetical protein